MFLLASFACRPDSPSPIVVEPEDTATEETGGTPAPPPSKLVAEVRFRAFVAWDASLQQIVDPLIDGQTGNISGLVISLYEEGAYANGDEDGTCDVVVELAGATLSPSALSEGFVWGIDLPAGEKSSFTDCLYKEFDLTNFVGGDPLATWGQPDWRFRLGGPLAQDTIDWLDDVDFSLFEERGADYFVAGEFTTATPPPGASLDTDPSSNFWYGYAMDPAYNVDFDTYQSASEMTVGSLLATGYYVFDQSVFFAISPAEPTSTGGTTP